MTPTLPDLEGWRQFASVVGAGLMSGYLAWKARGRKDLRAPFSPEKGAQPRVITRDEWHSAVQLINAWPGLSSKVRGIDGRLQTIEGDVAHHVQRFDEHVRRSNDTKESFVRLEAAFNAHVKAWGEAGMRAIEDRQEVKDSIRGLTSKIDDLAREIRNR